MTRKIDDIQIHLYDKKSATVQYEGVIYVFLDDRKTKDGQMQDLGYLLHELLKK